MQFDDGVAPPPVPGRLLAMLAVALAALIGLLVILEQVGGDGEISVALVTAFLVLALVGLGAMGRASQLSSFLYAGRRVPGGYAGVALAAALMPGAGLAAYAGRLRADGFDALWLPAGWFAGLVLLGALIAPAYRKSGACSVADLFNRRFGGHAARLSAALAVAIAGLCFFVAAIKAVTLVVTLFLGVPDQIALAAVFGLILVPVLFGGMRSVTWVQVGLGGALLAGVLGPAIAAILVMTGAPLPQLALGDLLRALATADPQSTSALVQTPLSTLSPAAYAGLALCLAFGTATTPHLMMPFGALASVSAARRTSAYALVVAGVLITAIPAVVALIDVAFSSQIGGRPVADWPAWLFDLGADGLASACGAAARDAAAVMAACGRATVAAAEIAIPGAALGETAVRLAGLPQAVSGLVLICGLAGILAVAIGALFSLGVTLGNDLFHKTLAPGLSPYRQLVLNRVAVLAVAFGVAAVVPLIPYDPARLAIVGLAISAGALFAPVVLALWWPRATGAGAATGILLGLAATAGYIAGIDQGLVTPILALGEAQAALIGVPVALLATVGVSLLSRKGPAATLARFHTPSEVLPERSGAA